jgi:hypothetical protein
MMNMSKNARSADFKLPLARLSYPNLFKPQVKDDGKKQFNATLLIPKSADLAELKAAIVGVAKEAWPANGVDRLQKGLIKSPLLDGDGPQGLNKKTGERHAGYAGHWFVRVIANEDRPPRLFNRKLLPATTDDIYAGCYVFAVVNAFSWSNPKNGDGISLGMTYVQAAKDGERLGGGAPPADKFLSALADEGDAPAEAKGGAGAAGLFA